MVTGEGFSAEKEAAIAKTHKNSAIVIIRFMNPTLNISVSTLHYRIDTLIAKIHRLPRKHRNHVKCCAIAVTAVLEFVSENKT